MITLSSFKYYLRSAMLSILNLQMFFQYKIEIFNLNFHCLQVITSPYSIGYSVLTDALSSSISMSNMINKANTVVTPSSVSVSYAIMDQGGNLGSNYDTAVSIIFHFLIFLPLCIFCFIWTILICKLCIACQISYTLYDMPLLFLINLHTEGEDSCCGINFIFCIIVLSLTINFQNRI